MPDHLGGALLIAAVALLFAGAWRLGARGRHGPALTCVLLAALLLRAFAAADLHLHEWDERFHALVAKNLRAHPLEPTLYDDPLLPYDHRQWFANHVWLHKPPLALWLIAVSLEAFGLTEFAVRLPSVLFSALSVLLTYRLGSLLFDARVGLLAAMLHAVNGFLIELASGRRATDHVDAIFIALVELGMWSAFSSSRGKDAIPWALVVGGVTGLALLTKGLPALLVILVWVVLLIPPPGRARALAALALGSATALAVALPWNHHAFTAFPAEYTWERGYDLLHLTEVVEGRREGPLSHLVWMARFFGELVYLPVAIFLYTALRGRAREHIALAVWLSVPYLVFSLARTKMPGYPMLAAPAVFLAVAWYWWHLRDRLPAMPARWLGGAALVLLLALPVRFSYERVRPFAARREPPWAHDLKELGKKLGSERCALFNVPRPVEAMFYTPCTSYPWPPGHQTVDRLIRRGYRVLVRDDGTLTPDLRGRADLRFVRLAD